MIYWIIVVYITVMFRELFKNVCSRKSWVSGVVFLQQRLSAKLRLSLNSESCEVSFIAKGFLSNRLITKVLYRCKQEMRLQTVCECVCVPFAMLTFNKNNLSLNLPLTRVVTGSTLSLWTWAAFNRHWTPHFSSLQGSSEQSVRNEVVQPRFSDCVAFHVISDRYVKVNRSRLFLKCKY